MNSFLEIFGVEVQNVVIPLTPAKAACLVGYLFLSRTLLNLPNFSFSQLKAFRPFRKPCYIELSNIWAFSKWRSPLA